MDVVQKSRFPLPIKQTNQTSPIWDLFIGLLQSAPQVTPITVLKYPHICIQMGVVEVGGGGGKEHTQSCAPGEKNQRILNDMGQLHYMLTESVISIPCPICYWTSVGPLCEKTEELYNRILAVWCISALVHAYVLFCIHIACRMWQFSFSGWGCVEG